MLEFAESGHPLRGHWSTMCSEPPEGLDPWSTTHAERYFTHQALHPPPPGLPTVRAYQAVQGQVNRRWLADRLRLADPRSS